MFPCKKQQINYLLLRENYILFGHLLVYLTEIQYICLLAFYKHIISNSLNTTRRGGAESVCTLTRSDRDVVHRHQGSLDVRVLATHRQELLHVHHTVSVKVELLRGE